MHTATHLGSYKGHELVSSIGGNAGCSQGAPTLPKALRAQGEGGRARSEQSTGEVERVR